MKMTDKYIEKTIEKIKNLINEEKYHLIGEKFYDLTKYGIVIENRLLVFICSELTDVFRNLINVSKEYEKELEKNRINIVIESTKKLLNYLDLGEDSLKSEDKQDIFELLISIIYNSESIQDAIRDIFSKKRIIRSNVDKEFI